MKVNKEIFYHANSGDELSIGDELIFDLNTHNKMYEEVYNNEYKLNKMDANEILINKKRDKEYTLIEEEFELIFRAINSLILCLRTF